MSSYVRQNVAGGFATVSATGATWENLAAAIRHGLGDRSYLGGSNSSCNDFRFGA
jgi:hypothetical protein